MKRDELTKCPTCGQPTPFALRRAGGLARAANMTPEQRRELARKAAEARWRRKETETPEKP